MAAPTLPHLHLLFHGYQKVTATKENELYGMSLLGLACRLGHGTSICANFFPKFCVTKFYHRHGRQGYYIMPFFIRNFFNL